jgi:CDP-diacylglycerol---glycerol-3-phosphate 3-phosphatidyltransferase
MMRGIDLCRRIIQAWVRVFARWLNRITGGRLHPDAVTIVGFLLHVPIALLIARGEPWVLAGVLLVVFGLLDKVDGELARAQHRESNHGGFLDATTDRMKEVLLYTGAGYWLALSDRPATAAWAVAACGASICVSYVRAKGETIFATEAKKKSYIEVNQLFRDGLAPFEIRIVLLIAGLLTGQLMWFVAAIAVLASVAALQRLWDISKALRA